MSAGVGYWLLVCEVSVAGAIPIRHERRVRANAGCWKGVGVCVKPATCLPVPVEITDSRDPSSVWDAC